MDPLLAALPVVSSTATLRRVGLTEGLVRRLVAERQLLRVRRGHFATPDAPRDVVSAVRLGGRLTSFSALRVHMVWQPPCDTRLHVVVARNAHDLRDPDTGEPFRPRPDVALHWLDAAPRRGSTAGHLVSPGEALRHLPSDLDPAFGIATIDSVLRLGKATVWELEHAFRRSRRLAAWLSRADPRAESGAESVARIRLEDAGLKPLPQVAVGRWRVDLMLPGVARCSGGRSASPLCERRWPRREVHPGGRDGGVRDRVGA
jgi:hypothetical protein